MPTTLMYVLLFMPSNIPVMGRVRHQKAVTMLFLWECAGQLFAGRYAMLGFSFFFCLFLSNEEK